jgi:hypothetical protein
VISEPNLSFHYFFYFLIIRASVGINDNAYKVDLPGEYNVSGTFNVADLSPYITDSDNDTSEVEETDGEVTDSRTNLFLGGDNDAICACFTKRGVTFDPTVGSD